MPATGVGAVLSQILRDGSDYTLGAFGEGMELLDTAWPLLLLTKQEFRSYSYKEAYSVVQ